MIVPSAGVLLIEAETGERFFNISAPSFITSLKASRGEVNLGRRF